ncbi:MAG: membrane or secreted protein [Chitinophagaceae bacterium]|nr:membrane or secreted protein [Chitinophagaceae bacterium]
MKRLPLLQSFIVIVLLFAVFGFSDPLKSISPLSGAWSVADNNTTTSLLVSDGYCMITTYDKEGKKFINTWGGSFAVENNQVKLNIEFNSDDKTQVGKTRTYTYSIQNNMLTTDGNGERTEWKRVDEGKGALAGNWRITQRKQDDKMADMPLRARRTLKLLTGTRFQWAAINIETGEFSGTGGGTYTFANSKYTEHIEFFSRDNSRVGSSLHFDGKVEDGNWIHSGLSSAGQPIYEIWSRFK